LLLDIQVKYYLHKYYWTIRDKTEWRASSDHLLARRWINTSFTSRILLMKMIVLFFIVEEKTMCFLAQRVL